MRRHDRRLKYVVLGLFVAVSSLAFLLGRLRSNDVDAASLANFDPGFIISDYTMSNYNSMSVAEIQAFLTMKNPCSNRDYNYYQALSASNPNVKWHWKDGHFVCLSEELFGDGMVIGEGKTAAQIIYETAQEYKINPQVLIVLIQKESSLITDPIPNNYDYRTMTGFGCPDTAPCDSKYFGFKNQIRKAAWLFREVLDGGWTNYPLGENYVQYNPNASCGGSIVNIRNLATSALYRYTPYQPNAGAISAGYGTAYCGAYGNRNFYLYFEDWFGGITNTDPTAEEINKVYEKNKNLLGEKKGKIGNNATTGISWQEYQNGLIVGNQKHGYYVSMGDIRKVWQETGFESGILGFPKSNISSNATIQWQVYEHGLIVGNEQHGYHVSMGKIREVWQKTGFETGALGYPTSNIKKDGNTEYQEYEKGVIYGNEQKGYFMANRGIYSAWTELDDILGFPKSNISSNATIQWQVYEHGLIVGNEQHGYYISMGKTRDIWQKNGFETGVLGYPTSNIEKDGDIEYQKYEKGIIYGNDQRGYFVANNGVYSAWKELRGILGFPKSNISKNATIQWQVYEHGLIVGNEQHGYHVSMGKIREVWQKTGFETGALGYPTSNIKKDGNTEYQEYEKGIVYNDGPNAWHILR